jgi:hypothetical protein
VIEAREEEEPRSLLLSLFSTSPSFLYLSFQEGILTAEGSIPS